MPHVFMFMHYWFQIFHHSRIQSSNSNMRWFEQAQRAAVGACRGLLCYARHMCGAWYAWPVRL